MRRERVFPPCCVETCVKTLVKILILLNKKYQFGEWVWMLHPFPYPSPIHFFFFIMLAVLPVIGKWLSISGGGE